MKKILLLAIVLSGFLLNAQSVFIPDANFRAYLNQTFLNYMDESGENLNIELASSYTGSISCGGRQIEDLTGIEYFTNATSIFCYDNQLSSLDISANTALTSIACGKNQLSELDVSSNINLTQILCGHNNLSSLNIDNNILLDYLNCNLNQLTTLDLSNNVALTALGCDNNQLSTLDLSNNTLITGLSISNNNISFIDISNLTVLYNFTCYNNQITSLDITNNQALTMLSCSSNEISSLYLNENTALTQLTCYGNVLTELDVTDNINLERINCSNNLFNSLDISNNIALNNLSCISNQFTTLDLSNNVNLTKLVISYNQFENIDVSNNINLTHLICDNNQLESIDLTHNTALYDFRCGHNQLESLDVSHNVNLGWFTCDSTKIEALDLSLNSNLFFLNCSGNALESLNLKNGNNSNQLSFNSMNNPNLYCIEVDDALLSSNFWSNIDEHASFAENCLYGVLNPNVIMGEVLRDDNCTNDENEQGLGGIIIKTEPDHFYGITNESGSYSVSTDTGTFQVTQIISHPFIHALCPSPNYHTVSFDTLAQDTTGINFHDEVIECPLLSVNINSDRRRRCFTNNTLVEFCNDGFADASDVEVIVKLPEYVILKSADYDFTVNENGNYIFVIGDLAQNECGTIHIVDSVACDEDITGLTQCSGTWILPNNDCLDQLDTAGFNAWDHSSVIVEGSCLNDTLVQFMIQNTAEYGAGDMEYIHEYRIYVDNALVQTEQFQLNGDESINVDYYANGQTIRLEADQHPMHPGSSHPQATVEACGDVDGVISLGFVNTMSMDDEDINVDIQCLEIIDSYDPNDKSVSPSGITDNHYVLAGTSLDYKIRFQNTGTDTAYTVVIVDTLSVNLDPSTIDWGSSSHPYTIDVSGIGAPILEFKFNNINLPDSTTHELGSHGFIKFKVASYDTLINGTEVNNTAHIFFDYNSAIVTNTCQLIISDTVLTHTPTQVLEKDKMEKLDIYPNPTTGKITIDSRNLIKVDVYNVTGQLIKTSQKNQIDLSDHSKGCYFIKVKTQQGISTQKIMLE